MRVLSLPVLFLNVVVSSPSVGAVTDEDRAACRAAHPGPAAEIAAAYLACLKAREVAAAQQTKALWDEQRAMDAASQEEAALLRRAAHAEDFALREQLMAEAISAGDTSAPAVAADLTQLRADLAAAQAACVEDGEACPRADALKAQVRDAELEQVAAEQRARDAEAERLMAEAQAAEERELAERRKKCAKVKLRVGATWGPRLQECYGPFALKAQDETGTVYEAAGGWVRVRGGKVVRWIER